MNVQWKQELSPDTILAMISQFLGFMLDAYDMALVLGHGDGHSADRE